MGNGMQNAWRWDRRRNRAEQNDAARDLIDLGPRGNRIFSTESISKGSKRSIVALVDQLAAGQRDELAEDDDVCGVLEEPDRAVAEEDVAAARVEREQLVVGAGVAPLQGDPVLV